MASRPLSEAEYAAVRRAARVLRDAGATEAYPFASAASGRLRDGSDIDLAIAGLPPGCLFQAMALTSGATYTLSPAAPASFEIEMAGSDATVVQVR